MQIQPIQTNLITLDQRDLFAILHTHLRQFREHSVLAITSKIVAICQGRVVAAEGVDRQRLIESEADLFLPPSASRYGVTLTIKDHLLAANAGIDESNGAGFYILWPHKPYQVVA